MMHLPKGDIYSIANALPSNFVDYDKRHGLGSPLEQLRDFVKFAIPEDDAEEVFDIYDKIQFEGVEHDLLERAERGRVPSPFFRMHDDGDEY